MTKEDLALVSIPLTCLVMAAAALAPRIGLDVQWVQAGCAVVSAVLTVGIVVVTRRQAAISDRQASISLEALRIANTSLPRPYLFIEVAECNVLRWAMCEPDNRELMRFVPRIKNYGNGPAILSYVSTRVCVSADVPAMSGGFVIEFHHDNIVPAGAERLLETDSFVHIGKYRYQTATQQLRDELIDGTKTVFLVGSVHYRDIFYRRYETAFCLSYDWGRTRISAEGGAEYNYQT